MGGSGSSGGSGGIRTPALDVSEGEQEEEDEEDVGGRRRWRRCEWACECERDTFVQVLGFKTTKKKREKEAAWR